MNTTAPETFKTIQIRTPNQSHLTRECWSIQIWGLMSCKSCEAFGTRECGGKKILKSGKNSLGYVIPLGGQE